MPLTPEEQAPHLTQKHGRINKLFRVFNALDQNTTGAALTHTIRLHSSPRLMYWICSFSWERNHGFSSEYGKPLHIKQHLLLSVGQKRLCTHRFQLSVFFAQYLCIIFFPKNIKKISYLTMSKKEREKAFFHSSFYLISLQIFDGFCSVFLKKSKQPKNNNKHRQEQMKMGDTMKIIWFLCSYCIHSAKESKGLLINSYKSKELLQISKCSIAILNYTFYPDILQI